MELWYKNCATRWTEALPVGNGGLGAMVWGGVETERIQLNEETLWSGHPRDTDNPDAYGHLSEVRQRLSQGRYREAEVLSKQMMGPYVEAYQPLGSLALDFGPSKPTTAYRRGLDLDTAVAWVEYQCGDVVYRREVFCSYPDNALIIHLSASRPGTLSFSIDLTTPHPFKGIEEPALLGIEAYCPERAYPNYYRTENPVQYETWATHRSVTFVTLVAVASDGKVTRDPSRVTLTGATEAVIALGVATSLRSRPNA